MFTCSHRLVGIDPAGPGWKGGVLPAVMVGHAVVPVRLSCMRLPVRGRESLDLIDEEGESRRLVWIEGAE